MQKTGIAARVVAARQAKHWTQADLAAATGLGTTTVKRIELNQFDPRLSTAQRLATELEVPLWWLLDEVDPIPLEVGVADVVPEPVPTQLLIGGVPAPEPLSTSAPPPKRQTARERKAEARRIDEMGYAWGASPTGQRVRDLIKGSQPGVLPIDTIVVADRIRDDLGNLVSLANSIAEYGLIQPITVDSDSTLVMGWRRLEAVRMLGRSEIDVRQLSGTIDPVGRCWVELTENDVRLDYSQYETTRATSRRTGVATTRPAQNEPL